MKNSKTKNEGLLTEEQIETLVMQLAKGQETFTETQTNKVLIWAKEAVINYALLELVLNVQLLGILFQCWQAVLIRVWMI